MNWLIEEVLDRVKTAFCKHDYIYETIGNGGFIFRCSKCDKGIWIDFDRIKNKLDENKLKSCINYPVSELYLPMKYFPGTCNYYCGRYVEKTISWFYRKYGVLISQYGIQNYGVSKEVREQS